MNNLEWLRNQKFLIEKDFENKINVIQELISIAEKEQVTQISSNSVKETFKDKFIESLEILGVFSKSREIAEKIIQKYGGDIRLTIEKISRNTSKWTSEGLVVKYQVGMDANKTWWGLSYWKDGDKIRPERDPELTLNN